MKLSDINKPQLQAVNPTTTQLSNAATSDIAEINDKAGVFAKFGANRAVSKAAGTALKDISLETMRAQRNIALTAVGIAEVQARAALVGNAMAPLGALVTRVNASTTAVDQALTRANSAETITHLTTRASTVAMLADMQANSKITADEAKIVGEFAEQDAAEDISRSRARMSQAKTAISGIHDFALNSIANAKESLG